ncbi:MAG: hypothetical protein Q9195_001391 [Heterodermia aff. obscurata]
MSGRQHYGLASTQEGLSAAPRRRQHAVQPPSLLTTTLGNAHISSHGIGPNPQTPISTTSLSSPFSVHQASPYPSSPAKPVASPPPPYSPRRGQTQETTPQRSSDVASPADTVSPDSNPSLYGTPVSAATTVSPDFAPRHQNGRSPLPRSFPPYTESPSSTADTAFPAPPSVGVSASSRVRSASKNHADRLISSLTSRSKTSSTVSPTIAIDTLQQYTALAIANAPAARQEDLALRPPASRRAASTGAIGLSGHSSRSASRSPSQSRWEPGMPLPPPPPGPPPPSARSQSLSRPPANGSGATELAASSFRTRRALANGGTSLGPVPPTPADWREEDQGKEETIFTNRSNGPLPLHIDTSSILRRGPLAFREESSSVTATPVNMLPTQPTHARRDSSTGALFRSPAVRNRSAKGIRERRSESRSGKERAIDSSNTVSGRASGFWPDADGEVRPTDIILPPSGNISRRRTSMRMTPKSGKSIRSLDEALSSTDSRPQTGSDRHFGSNGTTPRENPAGPEHWAEAVDLTSPSSGCDASRGAPGLPTLPASSSASNAASMPLGVSGLRSVLPPSQRTASEERPVSHLLHIPNSDDSMQAPLLPYSPPSTEIQVDLLGPESPKAFAQRANDRHHRFAEREAAATDDSERLDLFLEFIFAESRIRRAQYTAVFEQEDIDVKDLVHGLFAQPKRRISEEVPKVPQERAKVDANMVMQASTASGSSAQGSSWHGDSAPGSGKHQSPITASSNTSPQIQPESLWCKDYIPSLSPIASMSIVTGQDEMGSRGRAPSRWFEDSSRESSYGDAFRVLGRSKRESKYMGVPRGTRGDPAMFENSVSKPSIRNEAVEPPVPLSTYGKDEYPPEKAGWHEEIEPFAPLPHQPSTPQSAPFAQDPRKLDISRLVTLPPPYPRHHPAVNNSHPDLVEERTMVRTLHDRSEPNTLRDSFKNKINEKRQRAESWRKHQRSLHEQDIQFKMEHSELSQEEFDQAEADIEARIFQSEKETVQVDFDLFQEMVVSPLHALFSERIAMASASLDVLSRKLFSDAQQRSPNLPQEEGDEQAELLEKLTQLKWLFEARENLHSEIYHLLSERNDKYKATVLLPYQHNENREKLAEAEVFFVKDSHDRRLSFEQAAASRCEAFLAVVENNVVRGVEVQLSAFWDIAPLLMQVLHNIPYQLRGFEIQIPADEFGENPSYYDHPLQYLYSLLSHAEKSTYQFIESQINLLCLLHEIRSLAGAARSRVEESSAGEGDWASRMAEIRLEEEKALMDDLKDKVSVVEGQWIEGLGSRIRSERERIRDWLVETGGWDEDAEWE